MSLDVYLTGATTTFSSSGIYVRENGQTVEISREEWDMRNPGIEPVVVRDTLDGAHVFSANITHNLGRMADAAGIYLPLWRPDECGINFAAQLIEPLSVGLSKLENFPEQFKAYNPKNGWGDYDGLVAFVKEYLEACQRVPESRVSVWR